MDGLTMSSKNSEVGAYWGVGTGRAMQKKESVDEMQQS
jgi:hypothetical protein